MEKKYLVIWTYTDNYGAYERMAVSPEAAAKSVIREFSDDFAKRVTIYVALADDVFVSKPLR